MSSPPDLLTDKLSPTCHSVSGMYPVALTQQTQSTVCPMYDNDVSCCSSTLYESMLSTYLPSMLLDMQQEISLMQAPSYISQRSDSIYRVGTDDYTTPANALNSVLESHTQLMGYQAVSCYDAVYEYVVGMFCSACDPYGEQYLWQESDTVTVQVRSDDDRERLTDQCTPFFKAVSAYLEDGVGFMQDIQCSLHSDCHSAEYVACPCAQAASDSSFASTAAQAYADTVMGYTLTELVE
ncbi:hypothetical protein KIPB_003015, partial [Kipferlia bialata]|eukprot:g3015.t1